jgi:hypothetical protein
MISKEAIAKLVASGHYQAASVALEKALDATPGDSRCMRLLAWVRAKQDRHLEAESLYARATKAERAEERRAVKARSAIQARFDPPAADVAPEDETIDDDVEYVLGVAAEIEEQRRYFDIEVFESGSHVSTGGEGSTGAGTAQPEEEKAEALDHIDTDADSDLSTVEKERPTVRDDEYDFSELIEEDVVDVEHDTDIDEVDDDLFLDDSQSSASEASPPAERIDFLSDWSFSDEDLFEFESEPEREELQHDLLEDASVSRADRALQHALELGQQYGWGDAGVNLLASIFETYSWSSTKRSLQRELERGLEIEELRLACELREVWQRYQEFSLSSGRFPYANLSWPLALAIVRSYSAYPEVEEVEIFLVEMFVEWSGDRFLTDVYPAFYAYVAARTKFPFNKLLVSPAAALEFDRVLPEDDFDAGALLGSGTNLREQLRELGLLADPCSRAYQARVNVDWAEFERMRKEG